VNVLDQLQQAATQQDDERYLLLDKLGQGGMGVVWLAEKLGPGGVPLRTVVLKTVLPFASDEKEMARRAAMFLREMAVTAALEHRNIVRVTDWGTDLFGDTHFFEMERIRGISVLDLLARRGTPLEQEGRWGPLPPQDIAWIGMQAAAGLHYAHNHARTGEGDSANVGVAHRDISPDNIMVDIDGEVKVTDWGITKALDAGGDASRTGMIVGKAKYMAPEQIRGQIDTRADVYSLGVTLTVALAGRAVFPTTASSSWESLAMDVLEGKRQPVTALAPHAPPALQALLESMMHLDREQRPRSAGELVGRFKDIAIGLGGDLHDVQQAFAARVQEHHKEGKKTKRSLQAHKNAPTKSTRRPISAATQPEQASTPGVASTQQLGGAILDSTSPVAGSQPALASAPSSSRSLLLAALGIGVAVLILLAAVLGFLFAGSALGGFGAEEADPSVTAPGGEGATPVTPPSPATAPGTATPDPAAPVAGDEPTATPTGRTQTAVEAPDDPTPPADELPEGPSGDAVPEEPETRPHRPRPHRPRQHSAPATPQPRTLAPSIPAPAPRAQPRPSNRGMGGSDLMLGH